MSKMKNFMMDIEEFCDGYAFGDEWPLVYGPKYEQCIDDCASAADKTIRSTMAGDYARVYLTQQFGEQ